MVDVNDSRTDTSRAALLEDAAILDALEGATPLSAADELRLDPIYVSARLASDQLAASLAFGLPLVSPRLELKERLMANLQAAGPDAPASPSISPRFAGSFDVIPGVTGVRTADADWKQAPIPGIQYKDISYDAARGFATRLVRFAPGVRYPNHRHGGTEEIFVLEGKVEVNGFLLQAGDYCRSEAGTAEAGTYTELGALAIVVSSDLDEVTAS